LAWLTRPIGFVSIIALLQLLHIVLRPLLTDTVGNDNVDQLFFSEVLARGYAVDQPPLYTWLTWCLVQLFGPSVIAVAILRYLLVFLIHLFTYLSARQTIADPRLQVIAGFAPMLLYPIGWRLHEADTYGVLMSVMVMATLWLILRLVHKRSLPDYIGLGVAFGLGLMSSGWFTVAFAAFLIALIVTPSAWRVLLNGGLLITLMVAAAILFPYGLWLEAQGPDLWGGLESALRGGHDAASLNPWWLRGYFAFVNLFVGSFPLWLILPILFPLAVRPLPRGSLSEDRPSRYLNALMLVVLALLPALAVALDIHKLHQFRIYALALPFIPLYLRRAELAGFSPRSIRFSAVALLIVALVVIQARFQHIESGPAFCARCRMQTPYPTLADEIRALGFEGRGTLVAGDINLAGNMRVSFPEARILSPHFSHFIPPPKEENGQCVVVWHANPSAWETVALSEMLAQLGVTLPPQAQIPRLTLPIPKPARIEVPVKTIEMQVQVFAGPQGSCK